ncbi:MAG: hypothetical protein M1840_003154 [Geoglossum simile]|nr:MAG: hypothetical protein M1840_003154 [Geoglossum simile]
MDDEPMDTPTGSPRNPPSSADLDFQTAVAVSMDELDIDSLGPEDSLETLGRTSEIYQTHQVGSSTMHPSAEDPQHGPAAAQQSLQEQLRICQEAAQYALEKRIELPLLNFVDADTLVFIDPPPVTRKGGDAAGGGLERRLAPADCAPHRMHSERLKATGSVYFIDALGPTKQFRTVRRRRLANLPPGIKYVIDLTPPEEGDTAVELTTELSCSNGVLQWFSAGERWEIPGGLINGHDDFEERDTLEKARRGIPAAQAGRGIFIKQKQKRALVPMDYTAVRHRSAIERVLNIIEGRSPRIDSAPKMWSVFCVAKFLDCTSVVKDHVLSWIYAERNERFIEVLPEVSLRIAEGLQNYMLCRDAFCVLVGEEALASVGKEISGRFWSSRARRGREGLDLDSFVTRVEYASKAFAERVNTTFTELIDGDWITEVPEFRKISVYKTHLNGDCDAIDSLSTCIRGFVKTRICSALAALSQFSGYFPSTTAGAYIGQDLFSCRSHTSVYGGIQHKEALLIRDYWMTLTDQNLLTQAYALPHAETNVPVFDVGDNFYRTVWSELLTETEKFNWLVTEIATKSHTSLIATGPACFPQTVPGPIRTDSGSSTKPETDNTNRLPIRPKSGHSLPGTGAPDNSGTKSLPIRPKSWIKPLTPSTLLDAGPSGCIAETDSLRPYSFGGLGSTIDPRDITIVQQKQDSSKILRTCREIERYLKTWAVSAQDGPSGTQTSSSGSMDGAGYHAHEAAQQTNYPQSNRLHFHPFNLTALLDECQDHILAVVMNMIKPSISFDPAVTDTLLSLDENEFKYLPLYAGGNDDGSGGVFDELIPNAVTGPIGPGPKYHIGMGSAASSEFDMVDAGSLGSSSFDTSMGVEDGYSDHLDRRRVYSDHGMSKFDMKDKGKAKEIDDDYDDMGEEGETVVGHNSDGEGDDEEFCDVEDDLMLFT